MIKIETENIDKVDFVTKLKTRIAHIDFDGRKCTEKEIEQKIDELFPDDGLYNKIVELYLCPPEQLEQKHGDFESDVEKNNLQGIEKYFDYKKIVNNEFGGWLMQKLNVKTCPYCNRAYTFTVKHKNNYIKPQFDHFYPQKGRKGEKGFPYLALSFYNLVPSCPPCNQKKSTQKIDINPHIEGFEGSCKFVIKDKKTGLPSITDKKNIEVDFSSNNKNITVFGLKELYNKHTDYIGEIIDKAQAYNTVYYDSLIQTFSGLGKTPAEIDRYVWGNYLEKAEHCNRPLSKLTSDVLEQIGIK